MRDSLQSERRALSLARRIVVKVGTSTLTHDGGRANYGQVEQIVRGIADLWNEGREVVLVTSGAIASGLGRLGAGRSAGTIVDKQALAAVGQAVLMQIYEKLFAEYGRNVAQVLLARQDLEEPVRRENARNTLFRLLEWGVVPIVNENDTVAVEEINFGDNDNLSALVACLLGCDLLVILTDIEGLYTSDPRNGGNPELLSVIRRITPELLQAAGGTGSSLARGGMASKLSAAALAGRMGIPTVVARGSRRGVLREITDGEDVGTLFLLNSDSAGNRSSDGAGSAGGGHP